MQNHKTTVVIAMSSVFILDRLDCVFLFHASNDDFSGVLVQCDASIKTIINKIDSESNAFIVEDLDDETLVIKESKLAELKIKLKEVSYA